MRTTAVGRLLRGAATALIAGTALLAGPAAQAHDVLEATNPADGATVQAVPASVVLTFDHTPIGVGTEVQVKDLSGTNQADGPAKIVDTDVTQALKPGAPAGAYTVVWRVVSADSHPIEGTFTFTAKVAGSSSSAASAAPGAASQPTGPQTAGPQTAATASSQSPGGNPLLWIIIAAAVLAAVAVAALLVRRALRPGQEE